MSSRKNKYSGTELGMEYVKATDDLLFLKDMTPKTGHLSNLSTNKKGKEVSVGKQISNYLKNMGLLERSVDELENALEKNENLIDKTSNLLEMHIVKKRYKGKVYSTTSKMIEAVRLFHNGKIEKIDLIESASWAENPEDAIRVAMMIAGIKIWLRLSQTWRD